MLRYVRFTLSLLVGVALTLPVTTGCQNFDLSSLVGNLTPSDNQDNTDQNDTGDENGSTDETGQDNGIPTDEIGTLFDFNCGTRSVDTAPASVFLQMSWTYQSSTSPSDSALAQALFGANPDSTFDISELEGNQVVFELDATGTVINTYGLVDFGGEKLFTVTPAGEAGYTTQFVVRDGCLAQDITDEGEQPEIDVTQDQTGELPELPENPCGPGQVALGRGGFLTADNNEEHICLAVTIKDGCVDCWFEDGVWHQRLTYTFVYTALGSLDNVVVADYLADPNTPAQTVNITVGDTAERATTTDITYQTSSSPEELGYTEWSFDDFDFDGDSTVLSL
jgi:hypothetical protein